MESQSLNCCFAKCTGIMYNRRPCMSTFLYIFTDVSGNEARVYLWHGFNLSAHVSAFLNFLTQLDENSVFWLCNASHPHLSVNMGRHHGALGWSQLTHIRFGFLLLLWFFTKHTEIKLCSCLTSNQNLRREDMIQWKQKPAMMARKWVRIPWRKKEKRKRKNQVLCLFVSVVLTWTAVHSHSRNPPQRKVKKWRRGSVHWFLLSQQ